MVLKNVLTVVLGLLAGAVIIMGAEMVLRFAGYRYTPQDVAFRFVGPEPDMPEFIRDPRLFWRIRPGSPEIAGVAGLVARHNEKGFRGPLVDVNRTPGVARVAFLGDSCTYGVGVPFRESYVGILGLQLQEAIHRPVEIIDGGVPGYSSHQGLRLLETEILPLRPDVVTVYFGAWNDFVPSIGGDDAEKSKRLVTPRWVEAVRSELSPLRLFMLIRQTLDRFNGPRNADFGKRERNEYIDAFREGQPLEGRRVAPEKFRANMTAIIRLCRAKRVTPVLINPPLPDKSQKDFPIYQTYNAIVTQVAQQENVRLIDAADKMARLEAGGEKLYLDWVHPNANGHKVIADLLAPEIATLLSATARD